MKNLTVAEQLRENSAYKKAINQAIQDIINVNVAKPHFLISDTTSGVLIIPLLMINIAYNEIAIQEIADIIFKELDKVQAFSTMKKTRQRELTIESLRECITLKGELLKKRSTFRRLMRILEDPIISRNKEVRQDLIMLRIIAKLLPNLYNCQAKFDGLKKEHLIIHKYNSTFIYFVNTIQFKLYAIQLLLRNIELEYSKVQELYRMDFLEMVRTLLFIGISTDKDLMRSIELTSKIEFP